MRKTLRGKPLEHNAAAAAKYERALEALVRMMVTETERDVKALFAGQPPAVTQDASLASQARKVTNALARKFAQHFAKRSRALAEAMVANVEKASKASLHSSLKDLSGGLSLKTDFISGPLRKIVAASVTDNVALIQDISAEYQRRVQGAVMRSITTGNGLADLTPALAEIKGITQRRAKNIALDQTRKAYNNVNRGRMEALGLKRFEWLHSGGGQKPRQDHIDMSGNVYSFDDLPIIDKNTGERGIPGQAVNCRCRMVPVLEFDRGSE